MFSDDYLQIDGVNYLIGGQIGQGTVGTVVTVQSPSRKKYAIKVITQYGRNPIVKQTVDKEIQVQQKFKGSPFIIQIYASMVQNKKMHILFELGTCSLRRLIELNTHIELRQFLDICLDTTKGLDAIHRQNLIHRDIKPENIICVEKTYKITDFGSLQSGTVGQGQMGTPLYLPPEIIFNQEGQKYNQKFDVWSLGVTLFETYFRLHPFYYLTGQIEDHKLIYDQLKSNIKALLPNFTMEKFMVHIKNCPYVAAEKIQRVGNILSVTPPEVVEQFYLFFRYEKDRPDVGFIGGMYESLVELVKEAKPKKMKLRVNQKDLPYDIRYYVDTINIFYDLSYRYGTTRYSKVEFGLQLGMWYWNFYNYLGQKYTQYVNYQKLKTYRQDKKILWYEVKKVLFDYWFELSTNKELEFFGQLGELKVRVLLCGAMFEVNHQLEKFLMRVSQAIEMEVQTFQMLTTYLQILQAHQIRKIEELLTIFFT